MASSAVTGLSVPRWELQHPLRLQHCHALAHGREPRRRGLLLRCTLHRCTLHRCTRGRGLPTAVGGAAMQSLRWRSVARSCSGPGRIRVHGRGRIGGGSHARGGCRPSACGGRRVRCRCVRCGRSGRCRHVVSGRIESDASSHPTGPDAAAAAAAATAVRWATARAEAIGRTALQADPGWR